MDEFAEIRRLQRWGYLDRVLNTMILVGVVAFLALQIFRSPRREGSP
jgi:hypothetical protein